MFPNIKDKRFKTEQHYTAIHVDEPVQREIPRTPPDASRRETPPREADRTGSQLDQLAARQDQLYQHQVRVADNQDRLAQHLSQQNAALNQAMLKQAISNRDLMLKDLAGMKNDEFNDHTRDLLGQHIKVIMALAQRFDKDIQSLEDQIHLRDSAVVGTNHAVNNLEAHHVHMLQDLKSRIVRCDTSISKHSKDIAFVLDQLRRLEGIVQMNRERLGNDIHRIEAEVIATTGELERLTGEQRSDLKHFRSDALHRIDMLESAARQNSTEFKDMLDSHKSSMDGRMDRMETKFTAMINKATDGWSGVMERVDQRIQENSYSLAAQLEGMQQAIARDRGKLKNVEKMIENKVFAVLESSMSQHQAELERAKLEFRKGFTDIQDSINNAKRVVEGKRQLLGAQLRKEMRKIRQNLLQEMPGNADGSTMVYAPG